MNHQRFGWRDDERSDRYPRGDSGPERFRGGDGRDWQGGYEDMERPQPYGRWSSNPREDYGGEYGGDMGYGRHRGMQGYRSGMDWNERERDRYGRFTSGRYSGTSGNYGGGMDWNEPDRDRYGRFTSGHHQGMGGYSGGGWNEPDRDRHGRFTSGHHQGMGGYSGGGWNEPERDRYGRFTSHEGDGRGWNANEQERDEMGRFTSQHSRGYGHNVGPHTGRGPKNYQRSEERIREDVCDRLEQDGDIDANEIDVKVSNGMVTLTGTVESRQEKHMAEQIAEDTPGVKDVQNQLRVSGKKNEQGSSTQHAARKTA